eukprot:4113275-Prymnesium_polylepis.1
MSRNAVVCGRASCLMLRSHRTMVALPLAAITLSMLRRILFVQKRARAGKPMPAAEGNGVHLDPRVTAAWRCPALPAFAPAVG